MRKRIVGALAFAFVCAAFGTAQTAKQASHMRPTGKGWGVEDATGPAEQRVNAPAVTTGNGISYHGGPVMKGTVNVYYIWYGDWSNGARPSDSATTVGLLEGLIGGLSGSGYENINTTYGDNSGNVSGLMSLKGKMDMSSSTFGTRLSDANIKSIVTNAIASGQLGSTKPDPNGLYFVLTSSNVTERSGFCTKYCGWHTNGSISGVDVKYSFVGNPDRCPSACEEQTTSPNSDSGADGMASIIAHESEEAISDPDLNAWYDSSGAENADKCAWKFGPTSTTSTGAKYNMTLNHTNWLIQMNWENARGGGCDKSKGGTFYNF
jgi:Phosphate-induced protein 1 conserved region